MVYRSLAGGVTVLLSSLLVGVGVAAFFTSWVGPLPTNVAHGIVLNLIPGLAGLACWRAGWPTLYLTVLGWAAVALTGWGFIAGEAWLYPTFDLSPASSTVELAVGVLALAAAHAGPELLPASGAPPAAPLERIRVGVPFGALGWAFFGAGRRLERATEGRWTPLRLAVVCAVGSGAIGVVLAVVNPSSNVLLLPSLLAIAVSLASVVAAHFALQRRGDEGERLRSRGEGSPPSGPARLEAKEAEARRGSTRAVSPGRPRAVDPGQEPARFRRV